jgi:Uma2 family endonuclease
MNRPVQQRMTVDQFLAWAEAQPQGRYELVDGQVVAMAPEPARHNLVKLAVWRALDDAIRDTLGCHSSRTAMGSQLHR